MTVWNLGFSNSKEKHPGVEFVTDSRQHIAQLASQYGWPLRSLFRHVATLEDVFVELTRKD